VGSPIRRQCTAEPRAQAVRSTEEVAEPTRSQLWAHALTCAVPMVGFGFMDNLVMIQVSYSRRQDDSGREATFGRVGSRGEAKLV
jgi:hypothetical protein